MEDQQAEFMRGRSSKRSGNTGGTDSIQSQIEELRKKEQFINAQLGKYNQASPSAASASGQAARNIRQNRFQNEPDSDDAVENPRIEDVGQGAPQRNTQQHRMQELEDYDDEDEIDSQTLREMREMYGD